MSQPDVKDLETKKPENKQVKYPLTYPEDDWWLVIMTILCTLLVIGYIVAYIIKSH